MSVNLISSIRINFFYKTISVKYFFFFLRPMSPVPNTSSPVPNLSPQTPTAGPMSPSAYRSVSPVPFHVSHYKTYMKLLKYFKYSTFSKVLSQF